MADLFRLNIVSKRQVTIPQRLLDLLGIGIGDELHLKVSHGKIVRAYPVRIAPEQRMSPDAEQRFQELEAEGTDETDITELMEQYAAPPSEPAMHYRVLDRSFPARKTRFTAPKAPKNFHRSDERIGEVVAESLAEYGIEVSDVELSVSDGTVTLRGSVPDKVARLGVELITSSVLGVKDVHNEIELAPRRSDADQAAAGETDVAI